MRKPLTPMSFLSIAFLLASCSTVAEASNLDDLAERWQARLGKKFTVVKEPPFVVAGDEAPAKVRARAKGTVRWAVGLLKKAYFTKDPRNHITILLFANDRSYRRHAKKLFGDEPSTPYGYYSHRHKVLVMNIATGGGTLVHEIVHPFVDANFPACPAWFNEGLGSLYEQSDVKDGKIVGLTNWRLRGLKQDIAADDLPSIATLCAMDDDTFYGPGSGSYYAMARYLLYYLQQKGLLRKYYHSFCRARDMDPTGYVTLRRLLKEEDMKAFQKRWQKWVLTLTFP